jgi:hypothetical protein
MKSRIPPTAYHPVVCLLQEAVSRATTLAQEVVELEAALLQAKSARIKVEKDAAESFDKVGV